MLTKITAMVTVDQSDEFHIIATAGYKMFPLAYNGLLKDIHALEYIDFEKDYYSQGYNKAVSIGDAQYLITGKMSLTYYRYMMAVLFNRRIFQDKNIPMPYQTVYDGNWDLAEMKKLAIDAYTDLNGNGRIDLDDVVGYLVFTGPGSSETDGFIPSTGLSMVSKTEDNYYKPSIDPTHWSTVMDNIIDLLFGAGTYSSPDISNELVSNNFANGKAAMITYRMYVLETTPIIKLGATDTYGILPFPKFDRNIQEEYASYVQDQCFLFGFPKTIKGEDLIMIGQFFEAYSSETYKIVKKAYYDKALTVRYARDLDSIKMLEILDSSVNIDPVNIFLVTDVNTTKFRTMYATGENTVSSLLASQVTLGTLNARLEEINNAFRELNRNK